MPGADSVPCMSFASFSTSFYSIHGVDPICSTTPVGFLGFSSWAIPDQSWDTLGTLVMAPGRGRSCSRIHTGHACSLSHVEFRTIWTTEISVHVSRAFKRESLNMGGTWRVPEPPLSPWTPSFPSWPCFPGDDGCGRECLAAALGLSWLSLTFPILGPFEHSGINAAALPDMAGLMQAPCTAVGNSTQGQLMEAGDSWGKKNNVVCQKTPQPTQRFLYPGLWWHKPPEKFQQL